MLREFDFISASQFPEKAEYIEKLIPENIEDIITYSGSIDFKFRLHTDETGYKFPIPGLRTDKKHIYKIETKSALPFKSGDIIRFEGNDKSRFIVTNIEYKIDKRNEEEYQFISQDWPGIAKSYTKIKIITLQ
jgi:hypothetical protein